MTPTDLAAALLADVPRYTYLSDYGHLEKFMEEADVLAALSRAIDPALTERAGEVLPRLRKADEYEPLGHDGWEAADLITALLAQNAALRAERDASNEIGRAFEEDAGQQRARAEAAEAKVEKLRGALTEHNDLLRSTFQIAEREGVKRMIASTNWDAFYNRVAVVLKRHHQTANEARAALTTEADNG